MTHWIVSWKTWQDSDIETPWPFQLIQHTSEFRKRGTSEPASDEFVNSIYLSGNEQAVLDFENQFISAVVLATMIEDSDPITAIKSIKAVFCDAEVIDFVEVPQELVLYIEQHLEKDQRPV